MARTTKDRHEQLMKFMYGKHADEPMYRAVSANFDVTVRCCDHCGTPMNASEVNDFGSLCETCYNKEYYGE